MGTGIFPLVVCYIAMIEIRTVPKRTLAHKFRFFFQVVETLFLRI
jgi:hypothetical protein